METTVLKSDFEELKPVPEKTVPEYLLAKAKHYAELGRDCWIVDGPSDEKHRFDKFDEETRKIGSAFYKLGLHKGDHVIYMIRDLCKVPLLVTGVWRANGVMRASYDNDDAETILTRVKEGHCKFIVCEEDGLPLCHTVAEQAGWSMTIITVNRANAGNPSIQEFLENDDGSAIPDLSITEEDPAIIFCTSGTTGLPKGAVHTHKSLLFNLRNMARVPFTLDKPNLLVSKATHISGIVFPLPVMMSGKTSVVVSKITQENIFNAAAKYKVGFAFAFPGFLTPMVGQEASDYDFSSIEIILSGGIPITPAIKKTLRQLPNLKDIIVVYGLTETMMCGTSAILKEDGQRETPTMRDLPDFSVGKPFPGTDFQIRDIDTLQPLGPNERGEICIRTPGCFQLYYRNLQATEQAFVDGYFRTGDIGYYDANGFVYVVDRLKEIFKYYNNHISPTELEDVIGKHPRVKMVCVVGVPDAGGQVPRAFVVLQNNSGTKEDAAKEIAEFANSKLAPYKQLQGGVIVVDELPTGKTGKVTRQLVAKLIVD